MDRLEKNIKEILDGAGLVVADIGAANGLPLNLIPLGRTATVLFFEPNPASAEALAIHLRSKDYADPRVLPVALSGEDGPRILHVTNVPTGSSLLKPGSEYFKKFGDPEYFYPMREISIETRRLDGVLADAGLPRLDALKIDTQGAELEILRGLGNIFTHETLCVELEIGYPGSYVDQPGFGDLDSLITRAGFYLFDLRLASADRGRPGDSGYYRREVFGVSADSSSITKRIGEADAVYFRDSDQVLSRNDGNMVRRLIVLMCIYGFFIDAIILAQDAEKRGVLSPGEADSCSRAIRDWHATSKNLFVDSPWFRRLQCFISRAWRFLQKRLLGRRFYRWTD